MVVDPKKARRQIAGKLDQVHKFNPQNNRRNRPNLMGNCAGFLIPLLSDLLARERGLSGGRIQLAQKHRNAKGEAQQQGC